jgi:aminobenzoyl-glutamate transport protein
MNAEAKKAGWLDRFLNGIEIAGNKLPDPAVLFLALMSLIWLLSWPLSNVDFGAVHPATGAPIEVINQVSGPALANLLSTMVGTFVGFPPLGVVLVALLGIGVAERTGFINAMIKTVLSVTPRQLLTPVLILVGVASHYAVDAG